MGGSPEGQRGLEGILEGRGKVWGGHRSILGAHREVWEGYSGVLGDQSGVWEILGRSWGIWGFTLGLGGPVGGVREGFWGSPGGFGCSWRGFAVLGWDLGSVLGGNFGFPEVVSLPGRFWGCRILTCPPPAPPGGAAVAALGGPGGVRGLVRFLQLSPGRCLVDGAVSGLPPGPHGLHIHEFGDLSDSCNR